MKKMVILLVVWMIGIASFNNRMEAQSFHLSVNIGVQPAWGPVGYDYVEYYYFPDINCYYNVNRRLFYYLDPRGAWIYANYLPYDYREYDLYRLYKVVINESTPWRYNPYHRRHFAHFRGFHNQFVIRDSRERRYHESRKNLYGWYNSKPNHKEEFRPGRVHPNDNRFRDDNRHGNEWKRQGTEGRSGWLKSNEKREPVDWNRKEIQRARNGRSYGNESNRHSRSIEKKGTEKGRASRSADRSERASERVVLNRR